VYISVQLQEILKPPNAMVCTLLDIQFKQIVHIFENKNNKQILTKDATQALRKEITRDKMGIAAILKGL